MSKIYEVRKIQVKGYGCIALEDIKKGTLILSEIPQCIFGDDPCPKKLSLKISNEKSPSLTETFNFSLNSENWIRKLVSSFYKMSENNQSEYLQLANKYELSDIKNLPMELKLKIQASKSIIRKMEQDPSEAEKILQIYEIYRTNSFGEGVKIKTSRFNHSCKPNANSFVPIPNLTGTAEVRAIKGKIF